MTYNQGFPNNDFPANGGNNQGQGYSNNGYDNFSRITLIGRMVNDPESKMMQNNSKVARSKIAVNHRGQNKETDFWFVEVWGNNGADSTHNFFVNYCGKGRRVMIDGVPYLNQKQDANGNWTYYPTIRIERIVVCDGPTGGQGGGNNQQQSQSQQQPPTGQFQQNTGFPNQQQPNYQQQQQLAQQPPIGFPPNAPGGQPVGAPPTGFPGQPAPVGAPVGAPPTGYTGFPQQ